MRIRRAKSTHEEPLLRLPLTAFIDVVLFLLLYFLIAGSLAEQESQLASGLKADSKASGSSDLAPQIVIVGVAQGKAVYQLGSRSFSDRASLVAVLSQLPKERGVFVKVSSLAPVSGAATALQACRDAGFTKVNYVPAK